MLSVTSSYPSLEPNITLEERVGQVYGYPLDLKDAIKLLNYQDSVGMMNFAEEEDDAYDIAFSELGGIKLLEEILHKNNPWMKKAGIGVHMKWCEDNDEIQFLLMIGIMYHHPNDDEQETRNLELSLMRAFEIDQSLTPSSFWDYITSEVFSENMYYYYKYNKNIRNVYTDIGHKIINNLRHNIIDTQTVLYYNKITPVNLWNTYFYDLDINHIHDLEALGDILDIMFHSRNISKDVPKLICTFIDQV